MSQKEGGKDYEFMNHFQSAVSNLRFLSVHTTFESNFLSNSPHFFFFLGKTQGTRSVQCMLRAGGAGRGQVWRGVEGTQGLGCARHIL